MKAMDKKTAQELTSASAHISSFEESPCGEGWRFSLSPGYYLAWADRPTAFVAQTLHTFLDISTCVRAAD